MKKKVVSLAFALLLVSGCGKIPTLSDGSEAVVSFKDGEMISVDDLYESVKDNYALMTLINMIDKRVLEETFADYIDEAKEQAEAYVGAMRENYETEDEFLYAIQYYVGLSSIEAYQDNLYLNYMQSHAVLEYAKSNLTDKEIEKYYEDEVVGDIELSHILITPETTDKMTNDEVKEAEKKAEDKAKEVLNELKKYSGDELKENFEKLAKENSKDDATKEKGGALGKVNKENYSSKYKEVLDAAYAIKDGELNANVVKSELGYHIILKTKSYDKPSLEDKKEDIKTTLANQKIAADSMVTIDALQHYRKEVGMEIEDSELKKQYSTYLQNQKTRAAQSNNTTTNNTTN